MTMLSYDVHHDVYLPTLMHDCMRLSGMFFMLTIGGGSAEMKHLVYGATRTLYTGKGESE